MVLAVTWIRVDQQQTLAWRGLEWLSLSHRLDQCHRSVLHSRISAIDEFVRPIQRVPTGRNGGRSIPIPILTGIIFAWANLKRFDTCFPQRRKVMNKGKGSSGRFPSPRS